MFPRTKIISELLRQRCFSTSASRLNVTFKISDDQFKQIQEAQKPKEDESPEPALHTKESPLIMGRVSSERYKKVVKVAIPKHRLNEHLLLYIRENDNIQVMDENNLCEPGDWVLLRRVKDPIDPVVAHTVEKVVYKYGRYIDPLTGRRTFGLYYDDDVEKLERIKLEI